MKRNPLQPPLLEDPAVELAELRRKYATAMALIREARSVLDELEADR